MTAHIIAFPGVDREARARIDAMRTARQVLAACDQHTDDAIHSACRVLWGWGTAEDHRLANDGAWTLEQRGRARERAARRIIDEATADEIAQIRRSRRRARLQIAAALAFCLALAGIATSAPAKIAATVLQAQEVQAW